MLERAIAFMALSVIMPLVGEWRAARHQTYLATR
jgi:hypothetical protein